MTPRAQMPADHEIMELRTQLAEARRILERIAGGDGYYPELARAALYVTDKKKNF